MDSVPGWVVEVRVAIICSGIILAANATNIDDAGVRLTCQGQRCCSLTLNHLESEAPPADKGSNQVKCEFPQSSQSTFCLGCLTEM